MANPKPPWWLKPMNKVLMAAMKTGLMKDGPLVLTVTGRKSGQPRSTPITPFEVDGQRYVVGGFPGADWVRNAQANPDAMLVRGKVRRTGADGGAAAPSRPARCCGSSPSWCRPASAS